MTDFETMRQPENNEVVDIVGKGFWVGLVWLVGLASTIYLVGYASFWTFLAVVFASPSSAISTVEYLGYIAVNAAPACCYAAIGITGLTFLSSRRFWVLGLSAILLETALAAYAVAKPGSIPMFTGWLL